MPRARARAKIPGCGAEVAGWRGSPISRARSERRIPEALEQLQRFAIPGQLQIQLFLAPSGGRQR